MKRSGYQKDALDAAPGKLSAKHCGFFDRGLGIVPETLKPARRIALLGKKSNRHFALRAALIGWTAEQG
jgi:hypothetical protein